MATQYVNAQPVPSRAGFPIATVTGGAHRMNIFLSGTNRTKYVNQDKPFQLAYQTQGRQTATFQMVNLDGTSRPLVGETCVIVDTPGRLFAGCLQSVKGVREMMSTSVNWVCTAVDKTGILDHRVVAGKQYTALDPITGGQVSVYSVIADIMKNFANGEGITYNLVPNDGTLGVLAADLNWNFPTVKQAFNQIANQQGLTWWVDLNSSLHFATFDQLPAAPFSVTENSNNWRNLEVEETTDQYYNKVYAVSNQNVVPGAGAGPNANPANAHATAAPLSAGTDHPVANSAQTEPFGPRLINGSYYMVGEITGGAARVFKSPDSKTWTAQDTAHEIAEFADAWWFSGSTIIVALSDGAAANHWLVNYDCNTDTWGTVYAHTSTLASGFSVSGVRQLSNGDIVIYYGGNGTALVYAIFSAGSWGTGHTVNSANPTVQDISSVLDPSDGITFVYNKGRDDDTYIRRLAAGSLAAEVVLSTALSDTIYTFGVGVVYNGNLYIPYYNDIDVVPKVAIGTGYAAPTWTKQVVDPDATSVNPFVNMAVSAGTLFYYYVSYANPFGGSSVPNGVYQLFLGVNGVWFKNFIYSSSIYPPAVPPITFPPWDLEGISATPDGVAVSMPIGGFAGKILYVLV